MSFIPLDKKVIITSNRDVQTTRRPSTEPILQEVGRRRVLFPRDLEAGGTWFAVSENGSVAVLLNGAWENHEPKPPYRKSRGLILLDLVSAESVVYEFRKIGLQNIEPFTVVIWEAERLFECRWDGEKKYSKRVDAAVPHVWSSATLYDESICSKRVQWFKKWFEEHPCPTQDQVLDFHRFTGDGDKHNDLLMDRNGVVSTVSITSVLVSKQSAHLRHLDLQQKRFATNDLAFSKAIPARS